MGLGNGSLDLLFIIPLALSVLLLHGVSDCRLGIDLYIGITERRR